MKKQSPSTGGKAGKKADNSLGPEDFNGRAKRFQERIYGSRKGEIRLALLWEQLLAHVPGLQHLGQQPADLSVLDLGAGIGQVSGRLAQLGHRVVLMDASEDMLKLAQSHFAENHLPLDRVQFVTCSLQDYRPEEMAPQDLVLCHAVLEWLDHPRMGLEKAAASVKPGGYLSLAYYNQHALVYRNLLHGNFDRIRRDYYVGKEGGFTPRNPLIPEQVEPWLLELGMQPLYRAGLRTFSDFMPRHVAEVRGTEEILEMERRFAEIEPYRSLGRYQHVICRKLG